MSCWHALRMVRNNRTYPLQTKTIHSNLIACRFFILQTHSTCRSRVTEDCGFGTLKDIIIPPYAISIPRVADLNKDLILGIGNSMAKRVQISTANNSSTLATDLNLIGTPMNAGPKSPGSMSKFPNVSYLSFFFNRFVKNTHIYIHACA